MVFKDIISRDGGVPWGETGMSTAKWFGVRPTRVRIGSLIATQPGVLLHALLTNYEGQSYSGDQFPHVINYGGRLYLEDGHHRVLRAAIRGEQWIDAKVLEVPLRPLTTANEPDTLEYN